MTGSISTDNCDVSNGDNTGCGITTTNSATYGSTFNDNGGGVYATLITNQNIIVWFWSRDSVPADVLSSPDPATWSTPLANFSGPCDFGSAFTAQQLVFDTTFCGDWAGEVWSQGGCASKAATCEDFVANNGDAFSDAYWSINGLKVFQAGSSTQASPSVAAPPPASTTAPVTAPLSILSTAEAASSTTSTLSSVPAPPTSPTGFSTPTTLATVTRPATTSQSPPTAPLQASTAVDTVPPQRE